MVGIIVSLYLKKQEVLIKCPSGQVMVIEDRGLLTEAKRCYTPGVSYSDMRPITTEIVK